MFDRVVACLLLFGCGALLSCASSPASKPPSTARVSVAPADIVQRLALLALGDSIDESRAKELGLGLAADPGAVVDALLIEPAFAHAMAPSVLLGSYDVPPRHGQDSGKILHEAKTADGSVVLTLTKPCTLAESVLVRPWWSPSETVRICKTSYRPETLPISSAVDCSGDTGDTEHCGCGPYLMWCMRDAAQLDRLNSALLDESRETIAYAVEQARPVEWLFTTPDSVRAPIVDFEYARSALACGAIKEWPEAASDHVDPPSLRPRLACAEGQHAGILTSTHLLHMVEGTRQRQMSLADILFCIEPRSTNTELASILALGSPNFRDGAGWRQLAAAPGCTTCHARMDNALQFFNGYPRSIDSVLFKTNLVPTVEGEFFFRDLNDKRGAGPLNPHEYGELAVKQPEFGACMVRRVIDHVFGREAGPAELHAVRKAFDATHELRPMMRAALVSYAGEMLRLASEDRTQTTSTAVPASEPVGPGGDITPTPVAREIIDRSCVPCHEGGATDLSRPTWPRALALEAVVQVGSRLMPKGEPAALAPAERRLLAAELLAQLFPRAEDRARAQRQFITDMNGSNVLRVGSTLHELDAETPVVSTHASEVPVEDAVAPAQLHYSIDMIARQARRAALDCRQRGGSDAAIDACIAGLWSRRHALSSRTDAVGATATH